MVPRLYLRDYNDDASTEDQAALVRAMLAGNHRAWRDFHARYDRLILRCISRIAGSFASCMADDEVREIQAKLLVQLFANDMSKLRSFDADRGIRLGTWVGTLATHCAVDHIRALRQEPGRESLDDMEDEDFLDHEPTPDEMLERKERLAIAAEMLRDLPEKDRELFTLYFGEGLDPEQIAARMQISVNTVYSKKHKLQSRFEARFSESRFAEALAA